MSEKLKNDCYNFPHTKVWCFGFCLTVQNKKEYINISLIHWLHKNIKSLQLLIWMPTNASNAWFSLVVPTLLRVRKITEFSLMADNGEDKTRKKIIFVQYSCQVSSLCAPVDQRIDCSLAGDAKRGVSPWWWRQRWFSRDLEG